MCTLKLGRYFTFIFICFVIIHSIALGSSYDIQPTFGCTISNYVALQYSTYFFYPVLFGFLPIIIASLFSMLAYHNVRRVVRRQLPIVRRKLDKQITAMVLMRVIAFVCLTLPSTAYRIYAINFPIPQSIPMAYAVGRLIQTILLSIYNIDYMKINNNQSDSLTSKQIINNFDTCAPIIQLIDEQYQYTNNN
ncbi:unnamed protein product [Adineta steineri]|uniref:G-protein coupled receptors family 1 profile domain-containing protein n=1 Tax=Adineta steineri TaxID=433720 RepID=A0A814BYX5_9BILA|nr:unnamed protein product [Adineta steineri]